MKEKKGGKRRRERERERGGGRVMMDGEKGDGSYQQVFNDQLREPK